MTYPNLFKSRYPSLKGKDWIRRIESDDRRVFVRIGQAEHEYGRKGGRARAQSAKRDQKGRFTK